MSTWIWLPAAVSLVGAGLAYLGAWSGTRQRDRAGRREEWGRRFTAALGWTAEDSERARALGRTLLGALARSELASAEERHMADYLLQQESEYRDDGGRRGHLRSVDKAEYVSDNDT